MTLITPSVQTPVSASTTISESVGDPTLGKDEFLQLLVAQLRNQDPLSPTNPEQMAAQLAQFSSLEQLIGVNDKLTAQAGQSAILADALNSSTALGVIGRDVLAAGDGVDVTGDGTTVTVGVGAGGGTATATIYDQNGNEVASGSLGAVPAGRQTLDLNGLTSDLEEGSYRYSVSVTDQNGDPVEVQTFMHANIDGVRYGPNGPVLTSGETEIPLANIVEVLAQQG